MSETNVCDVCGKQESMWTAQGWQFVKDRHGRQVLVCSEICARTVQGQR